MKTMITCLLIILCSMVMTCCCIFPDEDLSMTRVDYNGDQLRIDGYYYYQHENPMSTLVLFLYRNGAIISTRAYPSHDLKVVEKEMLSEYDKIRNEKIRWGVFMIIENKIECEKWVLPTEVTSVKKMYGNIENDTTFHITKIFHAYNKKTYDTNEIWRFKQFENKPDSSNNYIR